MLNGENYIYNTFTGLNGINQNELDNQNLQLQINNLNNINNTLSGYISLNNYQINKINIELLGISGLLYNTSNNLSFNNIYTNNIYNILDNNVHFSFDGNISLNYYNYGLVLQSDGNLVLYENGGAVWDTRDSINQMNNNTNNIYYNLNQINNLYNEVTTISGF